MRECQVPPHHAGFPCESFDLMYNNTIILQYMFCSRSASSCLFYPTQLERTQAVAKCFNWNTHLQRAKHNPQPHCKDKEAPAWQSSAKARCVQWISEGSYFGWFHPSYSPSSSSNSPSSSAVASWYCWYSETRSFMLDSASVNSISSIPSPVYQCKKALRRRHVNSIRREMAEQTNMQSKWLLPADSQQKDCQWDKIHSKLI